MAKQNRWESAIRAINPELRPAQMTMSGDVYEPPKWGSLSRETKDLARAVICGFIWAGPLWATGAIALWKGVDMFLTLLMAGNVALVLGFVFWHGMTLYERANRKNSITFASPEPEPEPEPSTGLVAVGRKTHAALPEGWTIAKLQAFAEHVANDGYSIAVARCTGGGKPATRGELEKTLRPWMVYKGLAAKEGAGFVLTAAGRSRFRAWARGEMDVI